MGRTEKVTRGEREEFWQKHLAQWRASGLSQAAYCRRHGVSAIQLSWWKHELARRQKRGAAGRPAAAGPNQGRGPARQTSDTALFVPIRVAGARGATADAGGFEVFLRSGQRVRVPADFDSAGLRRLLAVLEGQPC